MDEKEQIATQSAIQAVMAATEGADERVILKAPNRVDRQRSINGNWVTIYSKGADGIFRALSEVNMMIENISNPERIAKQLAGLNKQKAILEEEKRALEGSVFAEELSKPLEK